MVSAVRNITHRLSSVMAGTILLSSLAFNSSCRNNASGPETLQPQNEIVSKDTAEALKSYYFNWLSIKVIPHNSILDEKLIALADGIADTASLRDYIDESYADDKKGLLGATIYIQRIICDLSFSRTLDDIEKSKISNERFIDKTEDFVSWYHAEYNPAFSEALEQFQEENGTKAYKDYALFLDNRVKYVFGNNKFIEYAADCRKFETALKSGKDELSESDIISYKVYLLEKYALEKFFSKSDRRGGMQMLNGFEKYASPAVKFVN